MKKFSITPYKESETGELEEIEEIIDVDGELKGCTPFTCEVLPQVRHNNNNSYHSTHLPITIILTAPCFSLVFSFGADVADCSLTNRSLSWWAGEEIFFAFPSFFLFFL